jgi:hypothetical protein
MLKLPTGQQRGPSQKAVCSYSLPSSKSQNSLNHSTCIIQQYILTFSHRDLNGYSPPSLYDILFTGDLNFSTWFTKNVNIMGTKQN